MHLYEKIIVITIFKNILIVFDFWARRIDKKDDAV